MAIITNKRSVITLYSQADPFSHRVRIVLAEKGVPCETIHVDPQNKSEELLQLNPYGNLPILVDRELVLYEPNIIAEYLDERFPHPPLMPVYPVARAKARLIIYRFDREWGPLIRSIESGKANEVKQATKELTQNLIQLVPVFNSLTYFMGDEFTLVDCCIAPILWRLPVWGITGLSATEKKVINKYAERIFQRDAFQASLTEIEYEMRKAAKEEMA